MAETLNNGSKQSMHSSSNFDLQNTFQRRDTINASRSSSMELPEGVQFNAPPRQSTEISRHRGSIDIRRHNLDSRQSMDLGARPAAEQKASLPVRGSIGSSSQNDYWENVSEENKAIIRQVSFHTDSTTADICCLFPAFSCK